jgi:hypothetical protein
MIKVGSKSNIQTSMTGFVTLTYIIKIQSLFRQFSFIKVISKWTKEKYTSYATGHNSFTSQYLLNIYIYCRFCRLYVINCENKQKKNSLTWNPTCQLSKEASIMKKYICQIRCGIKISFLCPHLLVQEPLKLELFYIYACLKRIWHDYLSLKTVLLRRHGHENT